VKRSRKPRRELVVRDGVGVSSGIGDDEAPLLSGLRMGSFELVGVMAEAERESVGRPDLA
jgi:hypothetical protein